MQLPDHGANPTYFVEALGLQMKENSIDFSVNTNPLGPPSFIKENWLSYFSEIEKYPDPKAMVLKEIIAKQNDVDLNQVVVGNGAAEIIFLLAHVFREKHVLIVEPTFSEYRQACENHFCRVDSITLSPETNWALQPDMISKKLQSSDLVFICNPNNPTGVQYRKELLEKIIKEAKLANVVVVIDEAFFDFSLHQESVVPLLHQYDNLVVLRSVTKMYAIAGIRLGYALSSEKLVSSITRWQHPWNTNQLAQQIGSRCLLDLQFAKNTARYIAEERNRLKRKLVELEYSISPSSVNYYLLKEKSEDRDLLGLLTYLIEHQIIPRHTYNFQGLEGKYIRLAIKEQDENDKLLKVLESWKAKC
ncbi:threonine-phosphate decarboxylase CobD [Alkalihalobacterium bogoriense]|uniref:threonine-phosphate decarboxylase CobD n=1 Tax=Alkalihalobacterium bogoriense TaxID=246272 RepID=UPI00047BF3DC|nr:threonine-phosphate decarboxylase CobD [Alkalihalobacterium bogoriense]